LPKNYQNETTVLSSFQLAAHIPYINKHFWWFRFFPICLDCREIWKKNIQNETFPGPSPTGMTLPRPSWVRLNHLRTCVGTVPLNNAQMGLGTIGELQMGSKGTNGRSHTNLLSPVPPSKRDTWFGGSRWWHYGLALKNRTENLMTRSAQTNKLATLLAMVSIATVQASDFLYLLRDDMN